MYTYLPNIFKCVWCDAMAVIDDKGKLTLYKCKCKEDGYPESAKRIAKWYFDHAEQQLRPEHYEQI